MFQAEEISSIKIFHYCGSLNFASRAAFKSELCSSIRLDLPAELRKHLTSNIQVLAKTTIQMNNFLIIFFLQLITAI